MSTSIEQQLDTVTGEVRKFIAKHLDKSRELDSRLLGVEQILVARGSGSSSFGEKSLGARR